MDMEKKYCIYGSGGFATESLLCLKDQYSFSNSELRDRVVFMVDDQFYNKDTIMGISVIKKSSFVANEYELVVCVGNPLKRKLMVKSLPIDTEYTTIIHPSAILSEWVRIGIGSVITAGTILTCNIEIGKHSQLNLNTTVGHDCILGDSLTTAPGVNISGRCQIDEGVYIGTGAGIRENTTICSNTVIGMGAYVVKNITVPGTYVGTPARLLR